MFQRFALVLSIALSGCVEAAQPDAITVNVESLGSEPAARGAALPTCDSIVSDCCCTAPAPAPTLVATSVQIDASAGFVSNYPGGPTFDGNDWSLTSLLVPVRYPVQLQTGDRITGFRVFVSKFTGGSVTAYLERRAGLVGSYEVIAQPVSTSQPIGTLAIGATGLSSLVASGTSYSIRIYGNGVNSGDRVLNAEVDVQRTMASGPVGATGPRERWNAIQRGTTESGIQYDGGDFLHTTANNAFVSMPVNGLSVGEQLRSSSVQIKGTGGVQQVTANLLRSDGNGGSTLLHTIVIANPPATWATYSATWTPTPLDTVTSGKSYYWFFNIPNAGTFLGQNGYTVETP